MNQFAKLTALAVGVILPTSTFGLDASFVVAKIFTTSSETAMIDLHVVASLLPVSEVLTVSIATTLAVSGRQESQKDGVDRWGSA